jgi:hypothetical protein
VLETTSSGSSEERSGQCNSDEEGAHRYQNKKNKFGSQRQGIEEHQHNVKEPL